MIGERIKPVVVDLAGRALRYDDLDALIHTVDPEPTHLIMGGSMRNRLMAGPMSHKMDFIQGGEVRYSGLPVHVLKSMDYPTIIFMAGQTEVARIDNCDRNKAVIE